MGPLYGRCYEEAESDDKSEAVFILLHFVRQLCKLHFDQGITATQWTRYAMDNVEKPRNEQPPATRQVRLDHHDSVRNHVHQRVSTEVERLERRIEALRLAKAPHVAVMISAYERMIDHKKGFLQNWELDEWRHY